MHRTIRFLAAATLVLALLAGGRLAARADDDSGLVAHWTFETGLEGWSAIAGGGTQAGLQRGKATARVGEGSLRFILHNGDADVVRGVLSPEIKSQKKPLAGRLRFRFWLRRDSARSLMFGARTKKGETYQFSLMMGRGEWTEFDFTTDQMTHPSKRALDPQSIRDLVLWCPGNLFGKEATYWIDDFRVEELPNGDASAGSADWVAVNPHPRLAVALDSSTFAPDEAGAPSPERVRGALATARKLGFGLFAAPRLEWADFELGRTVYSWHPYDVLADAAAAEQMGLVVEFGGLAPSEGEPAPRFPPDLAAAADFDGLAPRYTRFLELFCERYQERLRFFVLSLAGIEPYFGSHEDRKESFLRLVRAAVAQIRKSAPRARVALRFRPGDSSDLVRSLGVEGDLLAIDLEFPAADEARMRLQELWSGVIESAGDRHLAVHAASCPSVGAGGGAGEEQAAFVRELLAFARSDPGQVEWLTWRTLQDEDPPGPLTDPPGRVGGEMMHSPASGLLTRDGEAKPAARAWLEGVKMLPR